MQCEFWALPSRRWWRSELWNGRQGRAGNVLPIFKFFIRFSVVLRWILQIRLFWKFWKLEILCIKYENSKSVEVQPCTPLKMTVFSNLGWRTTLFLRLMKTPCYFALDDSAEKPREMWITQVYGSKQRFLHRLTGELITFDHLSWYPFSTWDDWPDTVIGLKFTSNCPLGTHCVRFQSKISTLFSTIFFFVCFLSKILLKKLARGKDKPFSSVISIFFYLDFGLKFINWHFKTPFISASNS